MTSDAMFDAEVLRLHDALTLQHWAERFAEHRDEAAAMMNERFCRMWEPYLAAAAGVFRHGSNAVLHLQVGRERDAIPVTRDDLWEARQRQAEAGPSA
ncbi:MAG: class I SAM-dependent methyltransferase [Rhodospirillales bacterium]|nr:class I SAM-dependent methyltransferase [Rhodospirillales bacterium]